MHQAGPDVNAGEGGAESLPAQTMDFTNFRKCLNSERQLRGSELYKRSKTR